MRGPLARLLERAAVLEVGSDARAAEPPHLAVRPGLRFAVAHPPRHQRRGPVAQRLGRMVDDRLALGSQPSAETVTILAPLASAGGALFCWVAHSALCGPGELPHGAARHELRSLDIDRTSAAMTTIPYRTPTR